MSLNKFIIYYSSFFFLLFQSHIFFLGLLGLNSDLIYKSYIFFYFFSVLFYIFTYPRIKKNIQLSTIFFVGSTIKFVVFFLIFRPILYQDNLIDKLEINIFFIPYLFSLLFTILSLSKLLVNRN